jgi:hypothetical protein
MECLALPWSQVMLPGQSEAVLAIAYQYRSDAVDGIYRPSKSCRFHALALRCVEVPGELDRGYVNGLRKLTNDPFASCRYSSSHAAVSPGSNLIPKLRPLSDAVTIVQTT